MTIRTATSTKEDGNLSYMFGERDGVDTNRRTFLASLNILPEQCVVMSVEHGEKIVEVDKTNQGTSIAAEALVTCEKDVALFLLTADCFPVVLHDPVREVVALMHLGWRPTGHYLAMKTVTYLVDHSGCDPKNLRAYIGPGIHKESYVLTEVLQRQSPEWAPYLHDLPTGETQVDILQFIVDQLVSSGMDSHRIKINAADTATSDIYFSHYRSKRTGEPEGRFATVVTMASDEKV